MASPLPRPVLQFLELLIGITGFGTAFVIYKLMDPDAAAPTRMLLVSVVTFWIVAELKPVTEVRLRVLFEYVCLTAGLNFLAEAMLSYVLFVTSVSKTIILTGTLISSVLITLLQYWMNSRQGSTRNSVVILGMDSVTQDVARCLEMPVLGVIEENASLVPPGFVFLGTPDVFSRVLTEQRPSRILVSNPGWAVRFPSLLLDFQLSGVEVETIPNVYERTFRRICCEHINASEMLFAPELIASSRTMAIQAIYTNLLGLFLLISFSPVLALVSLAVVISSRGPAFQRIECLGFQKIPFRLLRFRTRNRLGETTTVGAILRNLRLVNLPQLINVVRGEMALFGPQAVRREFADRLSAIMPVYPTRFSIKPGIVGWAQVHRRRREVQDESLKIEYDLYYIQESSSALDLEIVVRSVMGVLRPEYERQQPPACDPV